MGDWYKKRQNVDQRFAKFGTQTLTDEEVWALSQAKMVMPAGSAGGRAYLAHVAQAPGYAESLKDWARMVADGVAAARYMAPGGQRRRAYVEGYDPEWGHQAAADGLSLAILGDEADIPGIAKRAEQFGCGKQAYQRIRDFVGGATVISLVEFRCALEWALGYRRDRVFEGRWEEVTGANWDGE